VTRTWKATDGCGNSATATQTINVQDVTAPVIAALPAPTTINCPAIPSFAVATATDACGSAVTLTSVDVSSSGACAGAYSVTRTWTATDACGNSSTASQTIHVQDISPPVINALPSVSTINCPATPSFTQATATDACGSSIVFTFNDVTTQGTCIGSYSVKRTWTATDGCGNSSTASQTINVQDVTGPVIAALPAPSTINCPAVPSFTQATATDACGSSVTLTSVDVSNSGACNGSYSVTRTWTATDACGNSTTAIQTIYVQDITAPVIAALPSLSTINCPATPSFTQATAIDACGSSIAFTFNNLTTPGACAGSYSVTRTWTATDGCGNSSTATQTINVQDVTSPVIAALPAPSVIVCPAVPSFTTASATDGCGSAISYTSIDVTVNGACSGSYNVTRTWTATDGCGNSSTASQLITVIDNTAPVITGSIPLMSVEGCTAASKPPAVTNVAALEALGVQIADACSVDAALTVTSTDVTTGSCPIVVKRTYRVTDGCGNSSTTLAMINITDTTPPTGPASLSGGFTTTVCKSNAMAMYPFTLSSVLPSYSDNCPGTLSVTLTNALLIGDNCLWILTYTFMVEDHCGNVLSNRKITYTGSDQTAPTGNAPAPSVGNSGCKATATTNYPFNAAVAAAGYTDNCGTVMAVLTNTLLAGSDDCNWGIVYVYKVVDECGNSLQNQQMVFTGSDQTPPTFTKPADITIFTNAPCAYDASVAVTGDVINEQDNCATGLNAIFTDQIMDGPCECSHIINRTWTLTDACGNAAASQVQIITVYSNIVTNTNDSGPGSLRNVISCMPSGATVAFAPALMDQTITLTSGEILINKNLTIAGMGMSHLTVSGNMTSRVFHLLPGNTLYVKNILLRDGNWSTNGGAVCAEGNVTFENLMLMNNFENGVKKAFTLINPAGATIIGTVEVKN
jgi:hypothetical protein